MRVKCLTQEHNTMSRLARARTQTARSEVEHTQVLLTMYLNFNNNAYYSFAEDIFEKFALQCCKLMKIIVKCNMYQPPREIKGRMTVMYYNQSLPNSCKVLE